MDCLKRKQRKRREQKKVRLVSPHVSPSHSQPSTLGTTANSTLPKVSSTGLWRDNPGVYAVSPAQFYYYERPYPGSLNRIDQYYMPRAVSDATVPQPGHSFPLPRPLFLGRDKSYFWPTHGQRFYHSQQMTPVYELPPTMGMEIYSYPYPGGTGGSRSRLLETRHTPHYYADTTQFTMRPRVERTKSDAENKKGAKPHHKKETPKKNNAPSQMNGEPSSSRDIKMSHRILVDDDRNLLETMDSPRNNGGAKAAAEYGAHVNKAFSHDYVRKDDPPMPHKPAASTSIMVTHSSLPNGTAGMVRAIVPESENISTSATDSMKMLAKNKTDDQKKHPSITVYDGSGKFDENKIVDPKYYIYQDDIYSLPNKNTNNSGEYNNPIITRMKDMVIERSRSSNTSFSRNDLSNPYQMNSWIKPSTVNTEEFQEVYKEAKVTHTKVTGTVDSMNRSNRTSSSRNTVEDLVFSDNLDIDEVIHSGSFQKKFKASSTSLIDASRWNELPTLSRNEPVISSRNEPVISSRNEPVISSRNEPVISSRNEPVISSRNEPVISATDSTGEKGRDMVITNGNTDTYDSTDDLTNDGDQIATSAFKFLDTYLSDDEGTGSQVDSPPLSPGGLRVATVF